jgi:DNA (cytosine-5)-methyltransferase 1
VTIVDLFAGCRGWDVGARDLGIDPIGVELDADACASSRAAGFRTIRADIEQFRIPPSLDGLIASPPCQDFSLAGKRAGRTGDRGRMIDVVPVWVEAARPRWVACEQVPPCVAIWNEHAAYYRTLGYSTWVGILNAADYGVPQTRRRAILLASLDRHVDRPHPTHERDAAGMFALKPWVTMAEALGWSDGRQVGFPRIDDRGDSPDGYRERDWRSAGEPSFALTEKARSWTVRTGANSMKHSRDPDAIEPYERSCDEPALTLDAKAGHAWRVNTGLNRKPGEDRSEAQEFDPGADPARTLTGKSGGEWQMTRPATTIAGDARVWPPGHKVNQDDRDRLGDDEANARYGDRAGTEAIRLTVEDALILQSFPPDFPLHGTKTSRFRQVGNAVPPLLARHVLAAVL